MDFLYNQLIANKQKAIVGFVLTAAGAFISQHGFTLDTTIGEILESLVYGVLGYIGVYVKRNR